MNKKFKLFAKPYIVWLFVLAILPIFVMLFLSVTFTEGLSFDNLEFSLYQFRVLMDRAVLQAFFNSFFYAFITTVISLVFGYLLAYEIHKSKFKNKFFILTVLILPMWTNLLLRTEALGNLMEKNNILTNMFNITSNLELKGKMIGVVIGLVLTYMPFMILAVYTALEKIDISLEEAALDLGLTPLQKFWKVIFPLSLKGVVTGSILVFLPSMSGFAISQVLGSGNIVLIGNIIEASFRTMDYNLGSLLSVIILVIILGALYIVSKVDKEGETLL